MTNVVSDLDKVAKTTPDLVQEQIERLKQIFPECVTEGEVDFDRLRATLGEANALADDDAYTFTWAGKQEAFRAIQEPSGASLAPAPEESVNWEETRHLFIEGENLEVLKLLYKSYFGKVKMIYIDPPYNTGNDFIYRDDYSEPRRAYLEKTGQMDAEGNVLTSNPETSGRYHSDWLTMMYPRLFVARQLLREDGVIFVSIDDNEVHHLRLMMNEIFGEENFVATFVRRRRLASGMRNEPVSPDHEYILAYARSSGAVQLFGTPPDKDDYPYEDVKGRFRSTDLTVGMTKEMRPNQFYTIQDPYIDDEYWPPENRVWRFQPSTMRLHTSQDNIIWPGNRPDSNMTRPRFKTRFDPENTNPVSTWIDTQSTQEEDSTVLAAGLNQEATKELRDIFGTQILEYPKPVSLLKALVALGSADDDIVVDFFSGSGTLAQAVLELNREDNCNRRFLVAQLPERPPEESPALQLGFETIADIGKERIRRVIVRMQEEDENGQLSLDLQPDEDLGFKVFKLASSTFREWEPPEREEDEALGEQLSLFDRGLKEDADPCHVIYEVILKLGYSLNSRIEPLHLESNRVYQVTDEEDPRPSEESDLAESSRFYICLDDEIETATLGALPLDRQTTFVCLDTALDDSQKVNLAMGCMLKVI
jgi:adenine-specific DNA-methyltransferase